MSTPQSVTVIQARRVRGPWVCLPYELVKDWALAPHALAVVLALSVNGGAVSTTFDAHELALNLRLTSTDILEALRLLQERGWIHYVPDPLWRSCRVVLRWRLDDLLAETGGGS